MSIATIERPAAVTSIVQDAIQVIQEHLDREARNRRMESLDPRLLCPMQKAELVQDLAALLR